MRKLTLRLLHAVLLLQAASTMLFLLDAILVFTLAHPIAVIFDGSSLRRFDGTVTISPRTFSTSFCPDPPLVLNPREHEKRLMGCQIRPGARSCRRVHPMAIVWGAKLHSWDTQSAVSDERARQRGEYRIPRADNRCEHRSKPSGFAIASYHGRV